MAENPAETSTQEIWFDRVMTRIRARDGVTVAERDDGAVTLEIVQDGASREITLPGAGADYAEHKQQFSDLRDALSALGIAEGASYTPPPPPKRGMTPMIQQARAKQREEFNNWQIVWRTIRAAEKNLDVEFELRQMMDYY